jgi:hypothetical protein
VIESIEKSRDPIPLASLAASEPRAAPGVHPRRPGRWQGLREWLLRTRALTAAREALPPSSSAAGEFRRRARLAYELGERVLDPIEPLAAGSGAALAAELFGQSTYWAVCAVDHGAQAISPPQLWSSELESLEPTRQLLLEASFVSLAELSEEQQVQRALDARLLAATALARAEQPQRRVETLLWQRFLRLGVCALGLLAVVGASLWVAEDSPGGTDLAVGKPWRASSTWADCDPVAGRCGGAKTLVFFHTKEDASPWIEYDLGAPSAVSSVFVRNRTDSVPDRAIPLLVEVSDDQKAYREVARRETTFRTWRAEFPGQRARYVRLRVPRRTSLHLERVSIYGSER